MTMEMEKSSNQEGCSTKGGPGFMYTGYKGLIAQIVGVCSMVLGVTCLALSAVMLSWDMPDVDGYVKASSVGISGGVFSFVGGVMAFAAGRRPVQGLIINAIIWSMASACLNGVLIAPGLTLAANYNTTLDDSATKIGVAAAHGALSLVSLLSSVAILILSAAVTAWGCCQQ